MKKAKYDQPKVKSGLVFYDKDKKQEGIYFQDKEVNSKDKFAILKTTDNGAYVRGNMLYYKLDGVEIYTELNNVIFVDLTNHSLTVRKYDEVLNQISPDDPEERQYIILMYTEDDGERCRWESMTGRTNTYEYIKTYINIYEFDPDKSVVLTDNVAFKDALSVTSFIHYLQNGNIIEDTDFNIDDYRTEISTEEFQ